MHTWLATWRQRVRQVKSEVMVLWLAYRDPRTPWPARVMVAAVVAYALSPIDLIPDAIPVLGYLDDLILVPLGLHVALRMIPPEVLADCRARLAEETLPRPVSRAAAVVIIALWLATAGLAAWGVWRWLAK